MLLQLDHGSISGGDKAEVDVRGWVSKVTQTAKDKWIKDFSDHSLFRSTESLDILKLFSIECN